VYPRSWLCSVAALVLLTAAAYPQSSPQSLVPAPQQALASPARTTLPPRPPRHPAAPVTPPAAISIDVAEVVAPPAPAHAVLAEVTLADIGFADGVRLANLGARQELFVPLPQDGDVAASELVLAYDDISAHEARRHLEILLNDRTVAAIALDGKSRARTVRIPLGHARPKDGYIKLSFLYAGAATLDRCIDVRYVGDSLTVRPETALEVDLGPVGELDMATTAALLPRDVTIALPGRRVAAIEFAAALTVARSLMASGRRPTFHHGFDDVAELGKPGEAGHWTRGVVLIGSLAEAANVVDAPLVRVAGAVQPLGTLTAVRVGGLPALLVSESDAVRAARLFASPLRTAARGMAAAAVGEAGSRDLSADYVTFTELGIPSTQVDVFGRAELAATIDTRLLPPDTRLAQLLLDVMVAPDDTGARAVVSAFVNDRLLGSTLAAAGEPTHLALDLPDGLPGIVGNLRVVVQRESASGNCRFEPQGYPAQILGSSALVLAPVEGAAHDFSDLPARFARGIDVFLPAADADHPAAALGLLAPLVSRLSADPAPIRVEFGSGAPAPASAFIALSDQPPVGASPRVRFDRGRVVVADRSERTLLDVGGFTGGAVAQLLAAGDNPGVWVRPSALGGAVPAPSELRLERGDVAFIDGTGVALAMSTQRDRVVRISYPEQVSWLTVAERFRSWIVAGIWLFLTAALLFILQRTFRRRSAHPEA
jgi:Bacterial cellulose synthase subunit